LYLLAPLLPKMPDMGTLPDGRPSNRWQLTRVGVLLFACSLSLLTYLDRVCISRVKGGQDDGSPPGIEDDLQFDSLHVGRFVFNADDQMGWVFAAFSVGYLLFEIPGGWLGDRWGARRVLIRIVLWWSVFTAATGLIFATPSSPFLAVGVMILVRFLFGAGEAGAYPNLTRVVRVWVPTHRRAGAQGMIWASARLGGAIAPLVIGWLWWLLGGWRPAFWVLGAIGAVWAVLFFWFYHDKPLEAESTKGERDVPETAFAGATEFRSGQQAARALASIVTLVALCTMAFSVGLGWYFLPSWLPMYFQQVYSIRYQRSEWLVAAPFVCGAAGCLVGGVLSDRLVRIAGRRWGRSLIGVFAFTTAGSCVVATGFTVAPWQAVLLLCLMSFFNDLALPLMWSVCSDVGGRFVGSVAGLMNMSNGLGAVLCQIAIPLVLHSFSTAASPGAEAASGAAGRWLVVYAGLGSAWFVGAICWLLIDASKPIFGERKNQPSDTKAAA
jgi:MFS family permease